MRTKVMKIDGEKLTEELKKRGVSKSTASKEIGMGENYLSNVTHRNKITQIGAIALQKVYNIDPEAYELKDAKTEPKPEPEKSFDEDALYRIIYTAVYNAMKTALES